MLLSAGKISAVKIKYEQDGLKIESSLPSIEMNIVENRGDNA